MKTFFRGLALSTFPAAQGVFGRSRHEVFLAIAGITTAFATLYLFISKYALFLKLDSNCNRRLLNSAQAWIDHGFWRLGGFLYFQEQYDGRFPLDLYKSHAPFYAIPHYFALLLGGESAFWATTGMIPVLSAALMAFAMAMISWVAISSLVGEVVWAGAKGSAFVGAVAAFTIAFSSEPVWSLAWNSFDGSYSVLLMSAAIAVAFLAGERTTMRRLSVLLLLLSALVCARFGLTLMLSLLFIRLLTLSRRTDFLGANLFSLPVIVFVALASVSHFIRVSVTERILGIPFRGSDLIPRMGLSAVWEYAGQGSLHYLTPLDAFTFMWRQSEIVINKLPIWISVHHFVFWLIALLAFALVAAHPHFFDARPCLELLLLVPLVWTVLLNQSAAEHPDLISILWLPPYTLGLGFLMTRLFSWLRRRMSVSHAYFYLAGAIWLFFLWQNQYMMRAYPQL